MTEPYRAIAETETDPGAPPTSDLWKAWAKNPIAIAGAADGAPKVVGEALSVHVRTQALPNSGSAQFVVFTNGQLDDLMELQLNLSVVSGANGSFGISLDIGNTSGTYGSAVQVASSIASASGEILTINTSLFVSVNTARVFSRSSPPLFSTGGLPTGTRNRIRLRPTGTGATWSPSNQFMSSFTWGTYKL